MDFATYQRVLAAYGNSTSNVYTNSTSALINDKFKDSPFYASIPINGTNTDVHIVNADENDPDKKVLLFRPNTTVNRGSIATIGSYKWMLMDFLDNPIFPKSAINRCNATLKWKNQSGTVITYDCIMTLLSDREVSLKADKLFDIPFNKYSIYVPYNSDTESILIKQRFLFNKTAYQVIGKDDNTKVFNGIGYIDIVVQPTETSPADDYVNMIPDNSVIYGNSSSGNTSTSGGGAW